MFIYRNGTTQRQAGLGSAGPGQTTLAEARTAAVPCLRFRPVAQIGIKVQGPRAAILPKSAIFPQECRNKRSERKALRDIAAP